MATRTTTFAEYNLPISRDPASYGVATREEADEIAANMVEAAKVQFPDINIEAHVTIPGGVRGPDQAVCDQIRDFLTTALPAAKAKAQPKGAPEQHSHAGAGKAEPVKHR